MLESIKPIDMANGNDQLREILLKLSTDTELTSMEKKIYEDWLNRSDVRGFKFITDDMIDNALGIVFRQLPWDEFQEAKGKTCPPIQNISAELRASQDTIVVHLRNNRLKRKLFTFAAACAVVFIVIAAVQFEYKKNRQATLAMEYETIKTEAGKILERILPDGSKVRLNTGSTLSFPRQFSNNQRKVKLNGEAFFEVKAMKDQAPFVITTNQQQITVLGTKFNVDAYDSSQYKATTLLEGSLQVNSGAEKHQLFAGQKAVLYNAKYTVADVKDPQSSMAWLKDSFSFAGTPLTEIMNKISQYHKITVVYEEGVADKSYRVGTFSRKEPLESILEALRDCGGLIYKSNHSPIERGDTIWIHKNEK